MNIYRAAGLGLMALTLTVAVQAQNIWKWRDADGRVQVSDRPPAASVPESAIIQRPANAGAQRALPGPAAAPAAAASGAQRGETELDAKKRKLAADKIASDQVAQQAAKEKQAAQKADTCRRARNDLAAVDSGMRIARANEKGEREFLDDNGRAAETQRLRQLVVDNCQ
ncbi:DUF4124 domain-containing protein [Ideonella sp.]|jgi:hypothetical protein|uniref:DUF4124 domain-containing protein n=1 Tax=Ideonella sp. TaxID=1929293 RepID=UPI0037BEE3A3